MRILFVGLVGESLPPPYSGIPKRALILARMWKEAGQFVGAAFTYRHTLEDDLGAKGSYFFEYARKPSLLSKIFFLAWWALRDPFLYSELLTQGIEAYGHVRKDVVLYAAYGVFIDRVYRTFRPDVVVAETALIKSFYAGLVAKRCHIPFVVETYAEVHDRSLTKFASEDERTHFWRHFFELPDLVIAPSDYCAIGPLEFLPKEKVHMVFATTLDVASYARVPLSRKEAREKLGITTSDFCVLAVGAFTRRKGHDHIIMAVAKLKERGVRTSVLLCGADDPAWLERLATERGVKDQVFFFRRLPEEELRALFKAADVYCDASNTPRACLGIALTEALASKLPAIAYNAGGLPEVVEEGKSGYLVPINDIDSLADTIQKVMALPADEREAMGKNGFARAEQLFDINGIAAKLLDELKTVSL